MIDNSLFSSKTGLKQSFTNKPFTRPVTDENKENNKFNRPEKIDLFEKKRLSAFDKLKKSLSSNLYEILNISPAANDEEIKKAYKKMSLRLHPDKNKFGNKEEFHQIVYAYKILGNIELKKIYDEQGIEITDMVLDLYEGNAQNYAPELNF